MSDRKFEVYGVTFEVDPRYSFIKELGQGSYGVVAACADSRTGSQVAIKKIPTCFEDAEDLKRLLREVRMLRNFDHENIIGLRGLGKPPLDRLFEDLYIVTELMDTDLYQVISSDQELSPDHVQFFMYQILRGLYFMHSASVMHRDLKPSNLLVNANCDLKICDLGLARVSYPREAEHMAAMTQYAVTRWYRPPELLLSSVEYTTAVDIW